MVRMAARKKIGVHSGKFHADDVLSVYLLLQTDQFADAEVIRSRDLEVLGQCQCKVDVGGIYNHEKRAYDHHQRDFDEKFPGSKVRMASCGLVYLHFGREVIKNILARSRMTLSPDDLEWVFSTLYTQFVEEIDAIDNGIDPVPERTVPRYEFNTGICTRIEWKNPHWRTPNPDYDTAFMIAVSYIGDEFEYVLKRAAVYGVREMEQTRVAFANRYELDPSGSIIEIGGYFQYNAHIKSVEGPNPQVLFVIYPREDRTWTVRTVGTGRFFEMRKKLPYAGLSKKELSEVTGIPGAIFSHKAGLITVFDTKEHALEFARMALRV
jgi:uncharacterized UPF0160 family protein